MDPKQKEKELTSAKSAVEVAKGKISGAKAELQTATEANDEAAKTAAQGKVTSAEQELATAEAKVTELQGSAEDLAAALLDDDDKLADGTDPKKKISISKDKFDDINEKAALLEQFGPVLAKLKADPALVEKLMKGDDPNLSIEQRMAKLEDGIALKKKTEIKDTITKAISIWPDFRDKWDQIKPLVTAMEATGISYADAVQRAYFAVDPDAMAKGQRLVTIQAAKERENNRGKGSMGGGSGGAPVFDEGDAYELNEADLEFANKTGIDPKLYQKHAAAIEKFADL